MTIPPGFPKAFFKGNPLDVLDALLKHFQLPEDKHELPFRGGAVGYIGYDMGRQIETVPSIAKAEPDLPDMLLGFYDSAIVFDHLLEKAYIVSTGLPYMDEKKAIPYAQERMNKWEEKLNARINKAEEPQDKIKPADIKFDFTQDNYCAAVQRIREHIYNGDVYIVNMTQRMTVSAPPDPWIVYRRLKENNPAPMAAYLNFENMQIVCASPERFLKVNGRNVETRPIKGTRPRGRNKDEDERMRKELLRSEKDRAELIMITDLERNDLGRVCVPGTVKAVELCGLEEYPTVFHTVSIVEGELEENKNIVDLIKAAFPGGSITGAPKIRAMEIIEELEPARRGVYCGSIGYIGFDGQADLNIVIRSLIFHNGKAYLNVGGGITYDSDPLAEYLETLDKARALLRALGIAEYDGTYSLIETRQ
ncbi:MAG TPA: aminodeoxychorismate synthase component I [Ignavibacteriales bacterium]|nr:aminodeoxychorismate synthase component I [Ignavibacteriales bacterium]